jgi:ubiquinone/menaquinone biosynthesis C-methylase UbiE
MRALDGLSPWINDVTLGKRMSPLRRIVAGGARGHILEIGVGTGLNFRYYAPDAEIVGIEPSAPMRRRAVQRAEERSGNRPIRIEDLRAKELPFDAASFDAVVSTFVLCSVSDLAATLRELRRVLKPGGALRLVEHVRSPQPGVARWQDRIQPVWGALLGGCHVNRDTRDELARAGFDVQAIDAIDLALPTIVRAGIVGVAAR